MIRLDRVSATSAPRAGERAFTLEAVSAVIMPGSTSILGARGDGGPLVLEVCAGRARARAGQVTVLGKRPEIANGRVAYVPLDPVLPEPLTALEVLDVAARLRKVAGAAEPARRLEKMGLGALAKRRVSAMTRPEIRGLALCEALTSRADVVLIEEPYVGTCAEVAASLPVELAACSRDGRTLVVATASTRVATSAGTTLLMLKGQILPVAGVPPREDDACVRVATPSARELTVALAAIEAVSAVSLEGGVVVARGAEIGALLGAVQRAIVAGGYAIESLETELLGVDDARARVIARMAS